MVKDKITFEIKWLENDKKWLLRVMHNGICVLAPREDSVRECLITADEYCNDVREKMKKKVVITVNYE